MDKIDELNEWNWSNFEVLNTEKTYNLSLINYGVQFYDAGITNIPSVCYDKNTRMLFVFWQTWKNDGSGENQLTVSIHKI